ncbi:DEAD/DEAH box helicase [Virgibacillus oceani]|uniref:Helicase SNF n=1 Tax=Virgibacillus oceani TaxID=1479511 RepID=A0A917HFQ8_9BACI|nr:DEAD/DEAH box helicase [Virgibacillus oceani]GGG77155.1 helicase SNF [Virgibacillus oceani]
MNIELNRKIIEDMCGIVSFKKGDSFYRANKVTIESYTQDRCEAIIAGTEDFHVTIEKAGNKDIRTTCSCPTLASFKNDCQHIAAVLLSIDERQHQTAKAQEQALTEGLMTIFNAKTTRSSGHQLHFEDRKVLDLVFTCKPVAVNNSHCMFGVEINIGPIKISNIRQFLEHVNDGSPCKLSAAFIYDPSLHCFQQETDACVQQLITVIQDERLYLDELSGTEEIDNHHVLLIPPSAWNHLVPLLIKAPMVKLEYLGETVDGIEIVDKQPLPLRFDFTELDGQGYQLNITGMNNLIVLKSYKSVLAAGKVMQLKFEDCSYLFDLKQMLDASGSNQIAIPQKQIGFFMEKIVPVLKRIGDFRLSEALSKQFRKVPLIAKLFLDRVHNRLLAGLEFYYENNRINPLDESQASPFVVRDMEKEDAILELMEDSSFTQTDGGYFLHNEALEYEFLYHMLPKLQSLVQVYATTAVRARVTKGNNPPKIRVKHKKERTNWLEFKFEMDGIPEKQIRDILAALVEKRKYYRLRDGSLLSLETKEFEEIKRFLNAVPIQDQDEELENGLNVPIIKGFRLLDTVSDDAVSLEESFHQFLDKIQNPDSMKFAIPDNLETTLRDYQKHGYRWMKTLASYGFGGILADDMGLGKTLQAIAFIQSELTAIRDHKIPVLIVCPSSLTYNWFNELKKFTPAIQAEIIDGNTAERINIQRDAMDKDVIITSYPLLRSDIQWFKKQNFHTVFFDEAQAFKNPMTQTARAVKKLQANYRFALTGTPVENATEELWSIFHVVFPELFGGLKEFSYLTKKKISRKIRPFLLRRVKEDVLSELPEKIESLESVELLPDQKRLYAAYLAKLRHDTWKHLDKDTIRKNRIKILAGLTRLRQICCHPALFVDGYKGSSAKFEQLKQIIEESRLSGRRVLIFSQFTKMLALIGRELQLQGLPFFYLDGQTPSEERVEICNKFNAGERNLFLISLKAGGTGLNLTGADTVILYDLWWNPAVEKQAADRAHRIGQTNAVQVIKLVARGTIEEKMNELQEKKRHLIGEIIDSDDEGSMLTEEDIMDMLKV